MLKQSFLMHKSFQDLGYTAQGVARSVGVWGSIPHRTKCKMYMLLVLAVLTACNTMKGVGQDIQAAGHAITGGAEEGRQKMNRN